VLLKRSNLPFDPWTSKSKLVLLDIRAHFVNENGQPVTMLLTLLCQNGCHKGIDMAEIISQILSVESQEATPPLGQHYISQH